MTEKQRQRRSPAPAPHGHAPNWVLTVLCVCAVVAAGIVNRIV